MKSIRALLFVVLTVAAACKADNIGNAWRGEYHYFVSGGETAGGSQIMKDITLKIGTHGGKESCELDADGYQTYDRILCTAVANKNQLALLFKSYDNGKIVNEIGVARYKVGETLFSLEKVASKNAKKRSRYIAHWGTYSPFGLERENVKDYFEKIK